MTLSLIGKKFYYVSEDEEEEFKKMTISDLLSPSNKFLVTLEGYEESSIVNFKIKETERGRIVITLCNHFKDAWKCDKQFLKDRFFGKHIDEFLTLRDDSEALIEIYINKYGELCYFVNVGDFGGTAEQSGIIAINFDRIISLIDNSVIYFDSDSKISKVELVPHHLFGMEDDSCLQYGDESFEHEYVEMEIRNEYTSISEFHNVNRVTCLRNDLIFVQHSEIGIGTFLSEKEFSFCLFEGEEEILLEEVETKPGQKKKRCNNYYQKTFSLPSDVLKVDIEPESSKEKFWKHEHMYLPIIYVRLITSGMNLTMRLKEMAKTIPVFQLSDNSDSE